MVEYKWPTAFAWLKDKVGDMDPDEVKTTLLHFAAKLDPDDIQDLFQKEMDEDGYFDPLPEGS